MKRLPGLFAVFILLGALSLQGKTIEADASSYGLWFNFGAGGGIIHDFRRVSTSTTMTFKFNRDIFTLRLVGLIRPISETVNDTAGARDVGLLYGRVLTNPKKKTLLSVGLGISVTMVGVRHDDVKTIGVPIEVQFFPLHFLGFYGFANINAKQSFYGLTLCLRMGRK